MRGDRQGFTLIELLIVVVIIGILAAIAIPKFSNTKEKAFLATMKADLRNLVTAQEGYLSQYDTYYNGALPSPQLQNQISTGVTLTLTGATATGWGATAIHSGTSTVCAIFYGSGAAAPATVEGQPACQ